MLKASTALVLTFSLGSLIGCTAGVPATTVQAANQPPIQQHSVNRYELHGSPDKVALLVDSETGTVWQYQQNGNQVAMIPVPRKEAAVPKNNIDDDAEVWERDAQGKLVCTKNCQPPTISK